MGGHDRRLQFALLNGSQPSKQRPFFTSEALEYPYEPRIIDRYILRFSPLNIISVET